MDASRLHSLPPTAAVTQMSPIETSHVQWQQPSAGHLSVSLTLSWTYPPHEATCFRVHYRSGVCITGPEPAQALLGEAHVPLYRVTDLKVPDVPSGSSCRLEFLVEPVPDDGAQVATVMWRKLVIVYSAPALPGTGTDTSA